MISIDKEGAITLLNSGIKALTMAMESENNTLHMSSWIAQKTRSTSHWCNTVACVCGYMALDHVDSTMFSVRDLTELSASISEEFDRVLGRDIGRSIYAVAGRVYDARISAVFTEEELEHPHLNGYSNLTDAIDYLQLVKSKVEALG